MINSVVLVGRLTKDPELRKTSNGTSFLNFTLAVNRRFKNQQTGQTETDWINCVAWRQVADTMAQYLHKGSQIGVEGRIQTRNYENQQGQRVYVTEVLCENFTFLESKSASQSYQQNQAGQGFGNQNSSYNSMNSGGYGNSSSGYSQPQNPYASNPYGANHSAQSPYSAPSNPYSQNNSSSDFGTDDSFDDGYDIASDDLPF